MLKTFLRLGIVKKPQYQKLEIILLIQKTELRMVFACFLMGQIHTQMLNFCQYSS